MASAPYEIFGLSTEDGGMKVVLMEGQKTIAVQMGHTVQRLGPKSARTLARRLNELALRLEKRAAENGASKK